MTKLITVLTLALSLSAWAETRWRRVESGRWELYTDAGEKTGSAVLRQLLEMENVFGAMAMPLPESTPPIRVVLLKNPKDFAPFRRGEYNTGIYQSGADRDYIILLDAKGEETIRAARHEFVHLVLNHTSAPLPLWMEEGLAEYFSTLQRKGEKVVAGRAPAARIEAIAAGGWMDPAVQLSARHESQFFADPSATSAFYAQSWALTHLLMQAHGARQAIQQFGGLLRAGVEQTVAFQQAFGRTAEQAVREARTMAGNPVPTSEIALGAVPQISAFEAREASEIEARLVRAEALLAADRLTAAESLYTETAKLWPEDSDVLTGLGTLALRKSDHASARQYLERAMAAKNPRATTYFEYAMLIRDTRGPEALVVDSLTKAVQQNPSLAEAWYLLGSSMMRQARPADAIDPLKRAAAILPRQSLFWEALGRAYLDDAQRELARDAAQKAVQTARTPEQSAMAQGLIREIEATPVNRPPKKPPVITPQGWQEAKGDSTVAGSLVLLDCATATIGFHIEIKPGQRVVLTTAKLNQVVLKGKTAQKREFVCGPQKPAPAVEAGYNASGAAPPAQFAPPAPPPAQAKAAAKSAKNAPSKKAMPPPKPKPVPPPVLGELVWLEFK
ncbi:MAG TPA: tetratricopeptide repeat protein [Paludibaculum sp.]|jgi:tetratricopeptide (TPR) repeat protein